MSKVDSAALKSGYFNFAGSSNVEYSMTSGFFLNGNNSVKTHGNNNNNSGSNKDLSKDSEMNDNRRDNITRSDKKRNSSVRGRSQGRKMSNFKRYGTCAPKLKKSKFEDISEKSVDKSKESYLYEDENISDCDHDNPAGILIELYK